MFNRIKNSGVLLAAILMFIGFFSSPVQASRLVLPVADDFLKGSIMHKGGGPTGSLIYEGLVTKNAEGGYDGWLADSWKSEQDDKVWTFSIVKNAKWHDGVPFTAHDIKFTYDYMKEKGLWLATVLWMVGEVKCPDDYTAVFHLNGRFPKFLDKLSHCPGIAIIPRHIWQSIENPMQYEDQCYIGTGPFEFVKRIPGQYFEMKAFDEYHGRKPAFDRVVLSVIKETDMRILALKSGRVDAVDGIPPWIAPRLGRTRNVKLATFKKQQLYELGFNCREFPTSSRHLRQALAYAVDREKICGTVFGGYADPVTTFLMPHLTQDVVQTQLFPYTYDLERARSMLEAGGFRLDDGRLKDSEGKEVRLSFVTGSKGDVGIVNKIAKVLKEDWKQLGIVVDIKQVDFSMWSDEVHKKNVFFIGMPNLMHDDSDDLTHFRSRSYFGKTNWYGYSNPDYDALSARLHVTKDPGKRKLLAIEMQKILAVDVPSVAICEVDELSAFRSDRIAENEVFSSMYGEILDLKSLLALKPAGCP